MGLSPDNKQLYETMTLQEAYHKWLGISPSEPFNYYRLLGIKVFESDPEVIANAADRQMAHIKTFQIGQYSDLSQRILGQLASAKVNLLNKIKKTEYDKQLKSKDTKPVVAIAEPIVNMDWVNDATSPLLNTCRWTPKPEKTSLNPTLIIVAAGVVFVVIAIMVVAFSNDEDQPIEKPKTSIAQNETKPINKTLVHSVVQNKPISIQHQVVQDTAHQSPSRNFEDLKKQDDLPVDRPPLVPAPPEPAKDARKPNPQPIAPAKIQPVDDTIIPPIIVNFDQDEIKIPLKKLPPAGKFCSKPRILAVVGPNGTDLIANPVIIDGMTLGLKYETRGKNLILSPVYGAKNILLTLPRLQTIMRDHPDRIDKAQQFADGLQQTITQLQNDLAFLEANPPSHLPGVDPVGLTQWNQQGRDLKTRIETAQRSLNTNIRAIERMQFELKIAPDLFKATCDLVGMKVSLVVFYLDDNKKEVIVLQAKNVNAMVVPPPPVPVQMPVVVPLVPEQQPVIPKSKIPLPPQPQQSITPQIGFGLEPSQDEQPTQTFVPSAPVVAIQPPNKDADANNPMMPVANSWNDEWTWLVVGCVIASVLIVAWLKHDG